MMSHPLTEIEDLARQESERLNHFYLGVEHLFMALVSIPDGILRNALTRCKLAPDYVNYVLRDILGQQLERHYWEGFRETPRYQHVLASARELSTGEPGEREIIIALLDEGDSVAARALSGVGIPGGELLENIKLADSSVPDNSYPHIESDEPLTITEKDILRHMFWGRQNVEVRKELRGGLGITTTYEVIVSKAGPQSGSELFVVRLSGVGSIFRERRCYEVLMVDRVAALPIGKIGWPIVASDSSLAGIAYSLGGQEKVDDLNSFVTELDIQGALSLAPTWYERWQQDWWKHLEVKEISLWNDYGVVFPPMMVAIYDREGVKEPTVLRPFDSQEFAKDDSVLLQDFVVIDINERRRSVMLGAGIGYSGSAGASRVEVKEVSSEFLADCEVGCAVRAISARVDKVGDQVLRSYLELLEPPFPPEDTLIKLGDTSLPNPIAVIREASGKTIWGGVSFVHGNLDMGNILVSDGRYGLGDFSSSIDGHTLMDWALFEISVLVELVAPNVDDSWDSVMQFVSSVNVVGYIQAVDATLSESVQVAVGVIGGVRQVVGGLLVEVDGWSEYCLSLLGVLFRFLSWTGLSLGARRLVFVWVSVMLEDVRFG